MGERISKKSGKKLLILLLCLAVIAVSGFFIFAFGVSQGLKFDTFMGDIQITGTWMPQKSIHIPSELMGKDVRYVMLQSGSSIEQLYLPSGIERCYPQSLSSTKLREIHVDEQNDLYFSRDGVLFFNNLGGTVELEVYPPYKEDLAYTIPNDIEVVSMFAFRGVQFLRELHVPSTVRSFEWVPYPNPDTCITDVYYHGTQEQWNELVANTIIETAFSDAGIAIHIVGE